MQEGVCKMNGEIKVDVSESVMKSSSNRSFFSGKYWIMDALRFAKVDTRRVTFALKVGVALLLASLLVLVRHPYSIFGPDIIWSVLTVTLMFEYTVGATFCRGFSCSLGTAIAGGLAILVIQLAEISGHEAQPCVIGFSIFIIGTLATFVKLWPSLAPYEYGCRVVLFTYCLIVLSGYRQGEPVIRIAMDRLYFIAIGAFVTVSVNALFFPVWAGEQLHNVLVESFTTVADALEECVSKYMKDDILEKQEFSGDFRNEPAVGRCREMLKTTGKLDSLANFARWEPPHGRFCQFYHPWSDYIKVGAVLSNCAYEVMALHGCLHSEIQAPYNLKIAFKSEIIEATREASSLLRTLGNDVANMKQSIDMMSLLKRVRSSKNRLQRSISLHSYLLTSTHELSYHIVDQAGHDSMVRKHARRVSWPWVEEDEDGMVAPMVYAAGSTAALSLATFTSLLVEFIARLDHLVVVVDELAKMAMFKQECFC